MTNPKPNSTVFFTLIMSFTLLEFSNLSRVESICAKRNFNYPIPNKPIITSANPPKSEHPSSKSSSSSSSSSSGATDAPDGVTELKSKYGEMLKSVASQVDTTNTPILNIPKVTINDPDIKKMCGATDFPDLCESTVAHFVDGRHDPITMLDFVIKGCIQYTQLAMTTAKKISESPSFAKIKTRFKDITDYYIDALENLQDAENAMKVKDIATVNINLSAALDDFGAYEDDWGEKSPMSDFDAKLTHMASNCLAVANLVKFN